jgi:phenylpyruvate tautomerase PptA (4-oxalocrotonate tautomerase family)
MAQVKIYGMASQLRPRRSAVSDAVHRAVVEAFEYPAEKRAHRFIYFEPEDYLFPAASGRTDAYTIIEISIFAGRSDAAKRRLIHLIFAYLHEETGLAPVDVEITLTETPRANWGLKGVTGDELVLDYTVEV